MYTIKDKFVEMCQLISNDNGTYTFWWNYMDTYSDDEITILKPKMENLLISLNENNDLLSKDIENEIWDML